MDVRTVKLADPPISLLHVPGTGQAILLIHGNSSCKEVFQKQLSFLNQLGLNIIVPDLPGHGASNDAIDPASIYSFPGYADILLRAMRALGFQTFHVLGWSLGGHVGIELWATNSNVLSLVISGTPPVQLNAQGAERAFQGSSMDFAGRLNFTEADARDYAASMMGAAVNDDDHLLQMVRRTDGRARFWMVRNGLNGLGKDQVAAVETVRKPLAIIQGKADPFVNIPYLCNLKYRNLWENKVILLPAGHAPHWELSEAFNSKVRKFLLQLI